MANKYSRWCSVEPCILRVDDKVKTVTIHPQQEHIAKLLSKDFVIKVTRTGCVINNNVEVTMKNTRDTPYVCRENGKQYSGAMLMNIGIAWNHKRDYESEMFVFEKK